MGNKFDVRKHHQASLGHFDMRIVYVITIYVVLGSFMFQPAYSQASESERIAPIIAFLLLDEEQQSCTNAASMIEQPYPLGGTYFSSMSALSSPDEKDYYQINSAVGQWWLLTVDDQAPASDPFAQGFIDTVLSVFSKDGSQLLAQNDDLIPRTSSNSEIIFRAESDATYCIEVQDYFTFSNTTPLNPQGPNFAYEVRAIPIDFDLFDYFNLDTEPNNTSGAAQEPLSSVSNLLNPQLSFGILGDFSATSDTDFYKITTPAEAESLDMLFMPDGIPGFGSDSPFSTVSVYGASGTQLLAQVDVAQGIDSIRVPVSENTDYFVSIDAPNSLPGTNNYYSLKLNTADENAQNYQETLEPLNNNPATPESGFPSGQTAGGFDGYFIAGELTGGSDTDWWKFEVINYGSDYEIVLNCVSWRSGSGVRNANFALFDNVNQAALQSETETIDADVAWGAGASLPAVPAQPGFYFLKVSADSFSSSVLGRFYRCGIILLPVF